MEKVLQRRDEEDLRSMKFLNPTSYGKVRAECEQRMVANHLAAIHSEFTVMVQQELYQDLRNAFALKVTVVFRHARWRSHILSELLWLSYFCQ